MIKVENLVKTYHEKTALDHFNLSVHDGEIFGLIGPNGSGKTTAIHCILGLLTYDSGTVEVFGEKLTLSKSHLKRRIGFVQQELALLEELTVYENIDYFCGLYESNAKLRKKYVEEAIEFVDLKEYRKFSAKKLSGGLKRRLNIACGISHKPDLIFLDEPTVAVDAQSRNFILDGIKKLKEQGTTIFYTTHYLEEIENLCDRITIIDHGKDIVTDSIQHMKLNVGTKEIIILKLVQENENITSVLEKLPHVIDVTRNKEEYLLKFDHVGNNIQNVTVALSEISKSYEYLYTKLPTITDIYLELTGKDLRQ